MTKIDAKSIYKKAKLGRRSQYKEETHCIMVMNVMNEKGTVSAFCKAAQISDSTFWRWTLQYSVFDECYRIGAMVARENWEEEGRRNSDNPEWNMDYWKAIGAHRHSLGKSAKVRMIVGPKDNPYIQYQQLCKQAAQGDFTSAEIKQLMESINVGIRAFESHKMQDELEEMKEDLKKMDISHGDNIISIESVKKEN